MSEAALRQIEIEAEIAALLASLSIINQRRAA